MGAVVNVSRNRFRSPDAEVRVGSYDFDNTGHIYSGIYSGSRYDGNWPLDDDYSEFPHRAVAQHRPRLQDRRGIDGSQAGFAQ